ncbi:MAG: HindVP family restriction endonuclease [Anaerolineales bacterium]|nr:HindVP family restriction endonuclease [Anaerolineales bacterium]
MMTKQEPSLFGLLNTNKDFSDEKSWGKNQFNNTFPASLACYMASKGIEPVYLCMGKDKKLSHGKINVSDLFGLSSTSPDLHFFFEGQFTPYSTMVIDGLEGVDLVTSNKTSHQQLRALEIKLTAVPDQTTIDSDIENQGAEIVVRPQTISYLALSIAQNFASTSGKKYLRDIIEPINKKIPDWGEPENIRPHINEMVEALRTIAVYKTENQKPMLLQTIWKTEGNLSILSENCFDIFVWSDFGFVNMFADSAIFSPQNKVTRPARTVCWLTKMLYDFSVQGRIEPRKIQDELTYNTRNDKSFALGGVVTNPLMKCKELTKPRIKKSAIKEIILGEGYKLLRPERRLDAAILGTPGLFD